MHSVNLIELKLIIDFFELYSICGYANCHSFIKLSEADMDFIQDFVRVRLMDILSCRCERAKTTLDENDKQYFFGYFEYSPENFEILKGERKLLAAAALQINTLHESNNFVEFVQSFAPPEKYVISKSTVDKLSPGLYFGKKNQVSNTISTNHDAMAVQAYNRIEPILKKY